MIVLSVFVLVTDHCITNGPTVKTTSTFYLSFSRSGIQLYPTPGCPQPESLWLQLSEGFTEHGVGASYRPV